MLACEHAAPSRHLNLLQEAEQRCSERQAELDLLKRQLADLQQARAQPSQEASSSDLATATIPSPPGSPRSGVTYWLTGMKAARAAQPAAALDSTQQPAHPPHVDQQHAAAGPDAPVLWEGPRQPGGNATHPAHAAQHVHFGQAAPQQQHHSRPAHADHAGRERELAESQARILRLQAENERLMEMGNELRAKQHRLELEAQQRHAQAAGPLAWSHAHDTARLMTSYQPVVAPHDGLYTPQAYMMQTAAPAYLQHRPVSHSPAMPASGHQPRQPWHPDRATEQPAAPASPLKTARTALQPFHPDHPNQSATAQKGIRQLSASPVRRPNMQRAADAGATSEAARMPLVNAATEAAADDSEELTDRLARIEALAERIAQSQLAASVPAAVRPSVRVPGLNSRAPQRNSLVPATTTLKLDESLQSGSSETAASQRMLPAAASARTTASQRAKLQVLQQRTSKPRVRNWNQQDETMQKLG